VVVLDLEQLVLWRRCRRPSDRPHPLPGAERRRRQLPEDNGRVDAAFPCGRFQHDADGDASAAAGCEGRSEGRQADDGRRLGR
jgi:hypothetical protein